MTIRPATLDDAPRVMEMALRFWRETPYAALIDGITPATLAPLFDLVLEDGGLFVAEVDGQLVGFIAGVVLQHPLTARRFFDELAWWVEPEYRQGRIGPKLLRCAEDFALQRGASVVKMLEPAGSHVGAFYARCGYTAVETAWQKVLDAAVESPPRSSRTSAGPSVGPAPTEHARRRRSPASAL